MFHKLIIAGLVCLLLTACATTETLNVWKEKGTDELRFTNVLVIGVVKDASYRRMYENLAVEAFAKKNIMAHASYKIFPHVEKLDKATVKARIEQDGFDSVMVTRMIDRKRETVHRPATAYVSGNYYRSYPYATSYNMSNTWYGYYDNSYQVTYSPAYNIDYSITTAETNFYDAGSEKLIWSAMTETTETSKANAVRSFVENMTKELKKSQLF